MRSSLFCRLVDLRAARVAKTYGAGNFIECLSRRVIHCASDDLELTVVLHDHKMRMSAGHDLADKRRFQIRVLDKVCGYMSLDMMNRHQRLLCGVSDSLCRRNAHEKRAHKTRSVGHSDGCDLI